MAFLLRHGQREQPVGERRQPPTKALPSSRGLGSGRLHNRWERGDTALPAASARRPPPTRLQSAPGTPSAADRGGPTPLPRLPARRALGRPCPPPPPPPCPRRAPAPGARGPSGRLAGAGPSPPAPPARTYCCRGCRSRRGAAGPGGSAAPCPRLRAAAAAAAARSDRKPDPHRTTKAGGRGRRAGGPAGRREGRPVLEAEVAERGAEAGGRRETGSREERAGAAGRAGGGGRASAPRSPAGHCGRGEPAADPEAWSPRPARQLATCAGLRGAQGRGPEAAANLRAAPAPPPPPPQRASGPGGVWGAAPVPTNARTEERPRGGSGLRRRPRLLPLPSLGSAEASHPQTRCHGET